MRTITINYDGLTTVFTATSEIYEMPCGLLNQDFIAKREDGQIWKTKALKSTGHITRLGELIPEIKEVYEDRIQALEEEEEKRTESFKVITVLINDDVYSVSLLDGDCLEVEIYNQLGFDCDKVGYYIIEEPDYNKAYDVAEEITDYPIKEAIQKLKDIYGAYPDKGGVISTVIHGYDVVFFQAYEDSKHLTFEI